eukprot:UN22417
MSKELFSKRQMYTFDGGQIRHVTDFFRCTCTSKFQAGNMTARKSLDEFVHHRKYLDVGPKHTPNPCTLSLQTRPPPKKSLFFWCGVWSVPSIFFSILEISS